MRFAPLLALAVLAASCNAPPAQTPAAQETPAPAAPVAETAATPPAPPVEAAATPAPTTPAAAAPAAVKAAAVAWNVDQSASAIHFSVNHKVYGAIGADLKNWTAKIMFDPADLAHSSAAITIPMTNVKFGMPEADAQWPAAEWLNTKAFPTASFKSSSFKALGGNKYEVAGTLTVKGKPYPITLPFTFALAGATATVAGATTLDRTKLDIGMQTDPGADWVDKSFSVSVKVRATKG